LRGDHRLASAFAPRAARQEPKTNLSLKIC
jgi:hypothetical protein